MNRTAWLQERRMEKFCDVLGRWEAERLSALDAAELLGMSERSFRRYRRRYEEEGVDGLFDRRLGKASSRRVSVDRVEWMLEQYRTRHVGWTVKHFHDHLREHHGFRLSYSWTKTALQRAGLRRYPSSAWRQPTPNRSRRSTDNGFRANSPRAIASGGATRRRLPVAARPTIGPALDRFNA